MPLPRLVADAFGVVTVSLVSIFVVLCLFCIVYSVYFHTRIQRHGPVQLSYFDGPWITRIAFISFAIWWCFGEIIRLSLLKGEGRLFNDVPWQEEICKFYIVSNIGFAEPSLVLMLVFLLRASLQKRDTGVLSNRWNGKTIGFVLIFCLPMFLLHLALVAFGPKVVDEEVKSHEMKLKKYLASTASLKRDSVTCTYPLVSTVLLGFFDCLLITYLSYLGFKMLTFVINKSLQRRIYTILLSVISFLPMRVCLLGLSVLPPPDSIIYEALVLLSFMMLIFCAFVGIFMLVYYPIADALSLISIRTLEIEELIPFADYYDGGASSLVVNQSPIETGRNSDASTKHSSISFRTMIRDGTSATDGFEDVSFFSPSHHRVASSGSPYLQGRPSIPLHGVPECLVVSTT